MLLDKNAILRLRKSGITAEMVSERMERGRREKRARTNRLIAQNTKPGIYVSAIEGIDLDESSRRIRSAQSDLNLCAQQMDYNAEEYMTTESNLPEHLKFNVRDVSDVEPPHGSHRNPMKRRGWSAFCRDFLGQNYGLIAQRMLELANSSDSRDVAMFLKFCNDMGKTTEKVADISIQANISTNDIYSKLARMTEISAGRPLDDVMEDVEVREEDMAAVKIPAEGKDI